MTPKFKVGDKLIQTGSAYFLRNPDYIPKESTVTVTAIEKRNNGYFSYAFKECMCSVCNNREQPLVHWVNVEINFKLAESKPKPKKRKVKKVIDRIYFASIIKKTA